MSGRPHKGTKYRLVTLELLVPVGIDDILMEKGMTFEVSDDGHGFDFKV